jgi:hypothetical protein
MTARLSLRLGVLAYLAAILLVPVGLVFWRTFEHGVHPAWTAVTTPDAQHAFWLTLEIAAIAVPLNTIFGVLCGLAIVRHRFPGKGLLNAVVDLPLALALASSFRDRPVRPGTVACGEVSLLGELRPVRGLERRLREAARLGFRRALVPLERSGEAIKVEGMEIVAVGTLADALAAGLVNASGTSGEG